MLNFVTKRDASGNRYVIKVNPENKTYIIDYNPFLYNFNYADINKKQLNDIENMLIKEGYNREV